ncbi:MAG: iron-sulfur cluster assembly scaffold protein, partial [Pseudomonadota bacterium]
DLIVEDDRIAEYGHAIQACAIGQAAAAMVGRRAPGLTFDDVASARDHMEGYLKSGKLPAEAPDWPELPVFAVVHHYPERHEASLLAFDAILEARTRLSSP